MLNGVGADQKWVNQRLRVGAQIRNLPIIDGEWRYSRQPSRDDPTEGWKIHVSATVLSAAEVLARAHPILRKYDAFFKVPSRPEQLASLNAGLPWFSQVGKFLTVYPRSADEAANLARELHNATRGLPGPRIPFDAQYRANSLVHYRYGAFSRTTKTRSGIIHGPTGKRLADKRAPGQAVPGWLDDPFQKVRRRPRPRKGPIGVELLAYRARMQRGKGGVYEALDLSVSPARRIILKEGRRHGETDWNGIDGYARIKHEACVLRSLRKAGLPVPQVFREFVQNENRYLVLERIAGRPLIPLAGTHPKQFSWRRAENILERLAPILSQMHAAGWVWRDCKPSHIFLHRGTLRLIDFEGACRIPTRNVLPWGSPNYAPVSSRGGFNRRAGTLEDDYALGVIVFQFMAGEFPPRTARRRCKLYRRSGCPDFLRAQLENLLQG